MDPTTINRLAQIRQQELLEQAARDRELGIRLIPWARLLELIRAFFQHRSGQGVYQPATVSLQPALDECPCE